MLDLDPEAPISFSDQGLPFGAHGSSNWVWLARIDRFERAVDIGGNDAHATGLEGHFASVVRLPRAAASGAIPVADAAADCVALRVMLDDLAPGDSGDGPAAALSECRRVLRDGGCVSFGFENGRWLSRAPRRRAAEATAAGLTVSRVRALTAAAGFSSVDLYYADPAFDAPTALIEPTGEAAHAFEAEKPMRSRLGVARPFLARAGLHGILYPAYLGIAYR